MPNYDRRCALGHEQIDCLEPITYPDPPCPVDGCGALTTRVWIHGSANAVIQDSIEGGITFDHVDLRGTGGVNRYDSRRELLADATRAGLMPAEEMESKGAVTVDTDAFSPAKKEERIRSTAAFLGLTVDEYMDRFYRTPLEVRRRTTVGEDMDETEFAIHREISLAELHGVSEDRPGSECQYIDNRAERG